ncbi:membrane-bound lytic murein transglycosylase B [Succinivibrio dextrinosolvens DSM 3072]|uniref:Membrane-bound lytic murein transglycosylase B n=2 Tax=Succinivibrio dextrinosolvens TaxID=83771 RepID=A0A1T4V0D5_9GAMM|nr:membrane-bound lytic murein transglycosylase B [Succinivibrio dextrinosolvens DSM 3072]
MQAIIERMNKTISKLAIVLGLSFFTATSVHAAPNFDELAKYAGVDVQTLKDATSQAVYQQKIIDAITRPSEGKPWWQYRKIFITTSRIEAAVRFYFENEKTLLKAQKDFGVPYEIICAIIGVETFFGKNMGNWRVLDALYTLGFNFPKREAYFSKEFARFVALASREEWNYDDIKGSYAGAMGMGQFMPSAYLDYAVDYDGDGYVNLFTNREDAIGSVANYFKGHGWQTGRGIYYPCHINNADPKALMDKQWDLTVQELYASGATTKVNLSPNQKIRLFAFDLENGQKGYAVGLENFHSIMRYNTSQLYARAVYELSEFIAMGVNKEKLRQGKKVVHRSKKP